MCNVKKYCEIYREIEKLDSEDTLQLELEADSEDAKDFYEMVGNYLLQKRQRKVISDRCLQ